MQTSYPRNLFFPSKNPAPLPVPNRELEAPSYIEEEIEVAKWYMLSYWQQLALDICQQSCSPGLIAGNTVQHWLNYESFFGDAIGMQRIDEAVMTHGSDIGPCGRQIHQGQGKDAERGQQMIAGTGWRFESGEGLWGLILTLSCILA